MNSTKFYFNYETLRDFAGSLTTHMIKNIEAGVEYNDVELWKALYIIAFPDALVSYCRDYGYCHNNVALSKLPSFDSRYKFMKADIVDQFSPDLCNGIIEAMMGSEVRLTPLVEPVFMALGNNYDIANIVTHMMYGDKFIAFREFANLKNSDTAREILLRLFTRGFSEWDGGKEDLKIFWGDLKSDDSDE